MCLWQCQCKALLEFFIYNVKVFTLSVMLKTKLDHISISGRVVGSINLEKKRLFIKYGKKCKCATFMTVCTGPHNKGLISHDVWWCVGINPIVTHLPQTPETGHMLTGRTSSKKEQEEWEKWRKMKEQKVRLIQIQISEKQEQWRINSLHLPSSLLLVVIQTLIVGFGPLCFAGCFRLQQSTS